MLNMKHNLYLAERLHRPSVSARFTFSGGIYNIYSICNGNNYLHCNTEYVSNNLIPYIKKSILLTCRNTYYESVKNQDSPNLISL